MHSPGPWRYVRSEGWTDPQKIIDANGRHIVADPECRRTPEDDMHLIAVAPELLAECKLTRGKLQDVIAVIELRPEVWIVFRNAIDRLATIIKQAQPPTKEASDVADANDQTTV